MREVEDAEVHRGHDHLRLLSRCEPGDFHRQRQSPPRAHHVGRAERDVQLARLVVDGEIDQPQRATRHPLGLHVERAVGDRHRIGARAPIGADFESDGIVTHLQVDIDELFELRADQRDGRLAREARLDRQFGVLARCVRGLVERHGDVVGRRGARRTAPADVEGETRLFAVGRLHVEPLAAPAHLGLDRGGRVGADVEGAVGEALGALDRLIGPMAVGVEPLVIVAQLIERPRDVLAGDVFAVGPDRDDREGRLVAAAQAVAEILFDAEERRLRLHRQRDDALDGAPAGFGDIDDELRLQRLGRRALGQVDGELRMALDVGLQGALERLIDRGELVVDHAGDIARLARQRGTCDGLQTCRAGHVEAAAGGAVEELGVERDVDRLALRGGFRRGLEREVDALGLIVLDQEFSVADWRFLRIGIGVNRPFADRRVAHQTDAERPPAHALIGDGGALVFDVVGPFHDQRERDPRLGDARLVAQQGGHVDRFAGAVDAALGGEEGVQLARRLAPRHAPVGEIERRLREAEEIIVVAKRRHDQGRGVSADPAREARIERDATVGVGRLGGEHLVVARDQPQVDARSRLRALERTRFDVQAVGRGDGAQAEVGDDHPLRGQFKIALLLAGRLVGVRFLFLPRPSGDDVEAGGQLADGLDERKVGDDVLVELAGDVHRAAPHLLPVVRGDRVGRRRRDRFKEILTRLRRQQIAVADAVDVHRHFGRVHRGQRRAELALARQHIGLAGEMGLGRAVLDVDFVIGAFEQRLADVGGQALAQHDGVALAVLQALDADLLVLGRNRRARRARHRDEGREVGLAGDRVGEIEASARRGGFVVDLVVENAEAVLLAQVFVGRADVGEIIALQAGAIGIERGAPFFVAGEHVGERRQSRRLVVGIRAQLVGGVGGGGAARDIFVASVRFGIVRERRDMGKGEPGNGVFGIGGDQGARERHRRFEIGRVGLGAQRFAQIVGRFAGENFRRVRLFAQGFGEPDHVARQILVEIGFRLGGEGRAAAKGQGRQNGEKPQQSTHGLRSPDGVPGGAKIAPFERRVKRLISGGKWKEGVDDAAGHRNLRGDLLGARR